MKFSFKTLMFATAIFSLFLTGSYATNQTKYLNLDANFQIQPTNIDDLIYLLIVRGPEKWFYPTFEFEAGNSLKVIGASEEYGELTGIWQEVEFPAFSFIQAQVEKTETETTTTTTAPSTRNFTLDRLQTTEQVKFLIDLWGISFASLPPPFSTFGMLMGAGAYLGENVVFIGFTSTPGEEPEFGSISPSSGQQESTLTDVTITARNTTFRDNPPVEILFSPPDGLTVSNISTVSNTEVEFDLQISVDAPVGFKTVIVTWDDSTKSITGESQFEVTD